MPVSLDDMMREVSPESRTEIERSASLLAAGYRRQVDRASSEAAGRPHPPAMAEALLAFQMRLELRAAALADREDAFQANLARNGLQRARLLYWVDALGSLLPMLMVNAGRLVAPRWLADGLRRHF